MAFEEHGRWIPRACRRGYQRTPILPRDTSLKTDLIADPQQRDEDQQQANEDGAR